jgi:signal transduction histidine kinase/ActR/RegA family two-component response regulator
MVAVTGVATTYPHVARGDIVYIFVQDDAAGVRILTEDASLFAGIVPGSMIEASGLLTHRRGVEAIFVETLRVTGTTTAPVPREVLVADLLSERYAHQLVRVTGTLSIANMAPGEPLGAMVTDRSGTIPVRITNRLRGHPDLAAEWAFAGDVEIVGIAGLADLEAPLDGGYRLAPREASDFVFVPTLPYGTIGFGVLLAVLVAAVLTLSVMRRRAERRADAMAGLAADLEASREALSRDLAERQRLERQLLQAQKMEALGRMAGGIAHDLNNMLTTVMGTAELLLGRTSDVRTTEGLTWIREAAERSSHLSRRLLALSRQKMTKPQIVDLDEEIRQLTPVLAGMVGSEVQLITRHGDVPVWVEIDPAQLKQMLLNLVVNANEAMPRGGRLVIETGCVVGGADADGHQVALRVTDSGVGIEPDAIDHVFEPFFSTKQDGSGLGLSIVYGSIDRAGGSVQVHTAPGEGTSFDIRLPTASPPEAADGTRPLQESSLKGAGTILLVEDDTSVRDLACQALDRAGYTVIEAGDGEEALCAFSESPQEFDLLLTDVIMPQMGGAELAEQVAEARPDMPVVFMSGYVDDSDASDYIADRNAVFLQKPWQVRQLLAAVGRVLGSHRSA